MCRRSRGGPMPVALTEEQAALAAAIHDWAAAHPTAEAVRAAEGTGVSRLPDGFAALGLLGVALPEAAGGADGTLADLAAGLAAAAEDLVPGPLLGTALGGLLLKDCPSAKEILTAVADGEATIAVALDESGPVLDAHPGSWLLVP